MGVFLIHPLLAEITHRLFGARHKCDIRRPSQFQIDEGATMRVFRLQFLSLIYTESSRG